MTGGEYGEDVEKSGPDADKEDEDEDEGTPDR